MCVAALAACGNQPSRPVDVTKVFAVKSTFGPEYRTSSKGPSDITPQMLSEQQLPPDVTFDPPDCEKLATVQWLPAGTQGKMAVVVAQGKGNGLIAKAVSANTKVPYDTSLTQKCKHVGFTAGSATGTIDVVDAPQISGAQTLGEHRQVQVTARGKERDSEVFTYSAYFGNSVVTVEASPVRTAKQQQPSPVDTERAEQLLTDAVSALRG